MKRQVLRILAFNFLAITNCFAQVEVNTVYLFPDTTTFLNETFIYTGNVGNAAVRFYVPDDWENFKIDKILVLVLDSTRVGQTPFNYTISIGTEPRDSVLFESDPITAQNYFPVWWEINIEPDIEISQTNNFFISGSIPMWICGSYWLDSLIMNQFLLISNSESRWSEGLHGYYAIKAVVKKTTTDINDEANSEFSFSLSQNYPNPFNPTTKIRYTVPVGVNSQMLKVNLKVYDVLGNEVVTLVSEDKSPGSYSVTFNAVNLPSGIYFYRIVSANFIATKKLILLK